MLVKLKNVHYRVPNGSPVYENLNLELYQGDFFGVLGRNGAGKTTLMDLLMGYRPATSGEISVLGEDPMSVHRKMKREIFVLSHDIQIQQSHSVANYLEFTSFFYPRYDGNFEKRLLDMLGLDPKAKFGALSTGQKVKAQVIAAFAARVRLILMDEVTAVLDPESRMRFFELLKEEKKKRSCGVIMATNIAEDLNGVVDKVLFIDDKRARIREVGEIARLFNLKSGNLEDKGEAA